MKSPITFTDCVDAFEQFRYYELGLLDMKSRLASIIQSRAVDEVLSVAAAAAGAADGAASVAAGATDGASSEVAASGAASEVAASGAASEVAASGAASEVAASGAAAAGGADGAAAGAASEVAAGAASEVAASGATAAGGADGAAAAAGAAGAASEVAAGATSEVAASGATTAAGAAAGAEDFEFCIRSLLHKISKYNFICFGDERGEKDGIDFENMGEKGVCMKVMKSYLDRNLKQRKGISDASEYYTAMTMLNWFAGCKASFYIPKEASKSVYSLHRRYKMKGIEEQLTPDAVFEGKPYPTEEEKALHFSGRPVPAQGVPTSSQDVVPIRKLRIKLPAVQSAPGSGQKKPRKPTSKMTSLLFTSSAATAASGSAQKSSAQTKMKAPPAAPAPHVPRAPPAPPAPPAPS